MKKDILATYNTLIKKYQEKESKRKSLELSTKNKLETLKTTLDNTNLLITNITKKLAEIKENEQNIRILDTYLIKGLLIGLLISLIPAFLVPSAFAIIASLLTTLIPIIFSLCLFFKKYPHTKLKFYTKIKQEQEELESDLKTQTELKKVLEKRIDLTQVDLNEITNFHTYQKALSYLHLITDYITSSKAIYDSTYFLISYNLNKEPDNITPLENKVISLKLIKHK